MNLLDLTPLQWALLVGMAICGLAPVSGYVERYQASARTDLIEAHDAPLLVPARAQRKANIAAGLCEFVSHEKADGYKCPVQTLVIGDYTYTFNGNDGREVVTHGKTSVIAQNKADNAKRDAFMAEFERTRCNGGACPK